MKAAGAGEGEMWRLETIAQLEHLATFEDHVLKEFHFDRAWIEQSISAFRAADPEECSILASLLELKCMTPTIEAFGRDPSPENYSRVDELARSRGLGVREFLDGLATLGKEV